MKRLFVALAILTPWITQSMEPQVAYAQDIPVETATEDAGRWVRLVEEVLPGEIPLKTSTRISQILAQKLLVQKPHIWRYILFHLSLSFKNLSTNPGKNCRIYFNPAGDKMVTLSKEARVARIWDAQTGKLLCTLKGATKMIHFDMFNPNGDKILTDSDRTARIWDTQTGRPIHALTGHKDMINSATFNPNGDKILSWSDDRTSRIWDTQTGRLIHTLWADTDKIRFGAFTQAGNKIITHSVDNTLNIWDTETGKLIQTFQEVLLYDVTGNKALFRSQDETSKIWDVETGKLLHTLDGLGAPYVTFNEASNKILTYLLYDRTAKIWDAEIGELLHTLDHNSDVDSATFNPTGDKILTTSRGLFNRIAVEAKIWHTKTGELLHTLHHSSQHTTTRRITATFNSTGNKILTHDDTEAGIWDTETGELLHTFRDVMSAEFDSTGEKLVTASWDGTYKIWDLEPLLLCKKFLVEEISHLQAAILLDIFHVIETRHYANVVCPIAASLPNKIRIEQDKGASPEAQNKIARAAANLNKLKRAQSLKNITFDFNRYPHLWYVYEAMPEAIRQVCDPYITKTSFEQDLKRPSSSAKQPSKRLKIDT